MYRRAREFGYQNDEIDEVLKLLTVRGLIELHQNHLIRELPSQAPNLDEVTAQLRDFEQQLGVLLDGFPASNVLLNLQSQAQRWQELLAQLLRSGEIDAQKVDSLGRSIVTRQNDLRTFAQEKRQELTNQVVLLNRSLRPINPDRVNALNNTITGSVNYVDQINVLRATLQRHVSGIKSSVEQVKEQIDQAAGLLSRDDLTYEQLAHYGQTLQQYDSRVKAANEQSQQVEHHFQNLGGWRTLVAEGSTLFDNLQQLGDTVRPQEVEFDRLVRDIRSAISSSTGKLDVLPNHSIYLTRLTEIAEQVRRIRNDAVEHFNNLQSLYFQTLVSSGLYRSSQLDRKFTYNFSAPNKSYGQLYEEVGNRLRLAHKQLTDITRRKRQDLQNLLNTPMLSTLPQETCQQLETDGQQLIAQSEQMNEHLQTLDEHVQRDDVIQDFPAPDQGLFSELVAHLSQIQQELGALTRQYDGLNNSISDFKLSPEEQFAFNELEQLDGEIDLIDRRNRVKSSPEDFWKAVRGLYEKRRIRVLIEKVRR